MKRLSRISMLMKINALLVVAIMIVATANLASAATPTVSFGVAFVEYGNNAVINGGSSRISIRQGTVLDTQPSAVTGTNNWSIARKGTATTFRASADLTIPSGYKFRQVAGCTPTPGQASATYIHVSNITNSASCLIMVDKTTTTPPPPPGGNATFTVKAVDETGKPLVLKFSDVSINPDSVDSTNDLVTGTMNNKSELTLSYKIVNSSRVQVNGTIPPVGYIADKDVCSPLPETNSMSIGVPGRIFLTGLTHANQTCTMHFKKDPDAGARLVLSGGAWPETAKVGDAVKIGYSLKNDSATKVSGISLTNEIAGISASVADLAPGATASGEIDWTVPAEVRGASELFLEVTGNTESGKVLTNSMKFKFSVEGSPEPTGPTNPPTGPTNPPTQPTNPPTQPTNPPTQPTNPPTQPTNPPTQPTNPPTQPTNPPTQPTATIEDPCLLNPTKPGCPPVTNPTTPTNPTNPTTPPTGPTASNTASVSASTATTVPVSVRGTQVTNPATSAGVSELPFTGSQSMFLLWVALVMLNGGYVINASLKRMKTRRI